VPENSLARPISPPVAGVLPDLARSTACYDIPSVLVGQALSIHHVRKPVPQVLWHAFNGV